VPIPSIAVGLSVIVFTRIPERAVVGRIQAHRAVVTPAMTWSASAIEYLRTSAGNQLGFSLRKSVRRICNQPSGISDAREIGCSSISSTVADRHIASGIDRHAPHPTVKDSVRLINLLLHWRSCDGATAYVDLGPLWCSRLSSRTYRVNDP